MTQLAPVVALPPADILNLQLSYTDTDTVTMAAGNCIDSTGTFNMVVSAPLVIKPTHVGLNALDTGTLGANKCYSVYVIGDSSGYHYPQSIISLSLVNPAMPSGYDIWRKVGYVFSGDSSHLEDFFQVGDRNSRIYNAAGAFSALANGSATTQTAITLTGAVPAIRCMGIFSYIFNADAQANSVTLLPSGENGPGMGFTGVAAADVSNSGIRALVLPIGGVPKIDYLVSTADDVFSLLVIGFEYYL
jgi:hypothetical protein